MAMGDDSKANINLFLDGIQNLLNNEAALIPHIVPRLCINMPPCETGYYYVQYITCAPAPTLP